MRGKKIRARKGQETEICRDTSGADADSLLFHSYFTGFYVIPFTLGCFNSVWKYYWSSGHVLYLNRALD